MPALAWRRNSRYADSTARTVAIRSGIWSSALQAGHHARMSESLGLCTPCSILLTRVKCWPVTAASARADRPASLRSSLRRAPSSSCACRAALDGTVLTMGYGQLPYSLEGFAAKPDVGGFGRGELACGQPVPGVGQEDYQAAIEQVEVVSGD